MVGPLRGGGVESHKELRKTGRKNNMNPLGKTWHEPLRVRGMGSALMQ